MWLLSLPKAWLTLSNYHLPSLPAWHHVESSSGVCQPQLQPQPVSSAASTSCLQEGPTSTPFFHFLCCSWCFIVADYSRPVAMTDCCCCPSPYWPHKIVQQSTCLLKPLIECMALSKTEHEEEKTIFFLSFRGFISCFRADISHFVTLLNFSKLIAGIVDVENEQ